MNRDSIGIDRTSRRGVITGRLAAPIRAWETDPLALRIGALQTPVFQSAPQADPQPDIRFWPRTPIRSPLSSPFSSGAELPPGRGHDSDET